MIVRLFFDAGKSWKSWYFLDIPQEKVDVIKKAFSAKSAACWSYSVLDQKDMLEIKAYFTSGACLGSVLIPGACQSQQWNKFSAENKKSACEACFMAGKCKNPFVIKNLGQVLLPDLYNNQRQK